MPSSVLALPVASLHFLPIREVIMNEFSPYHGFLILLIESACMVVLCALAVWATVRCGRRRFEQTVPLRVGRVAARGTVWLGRTKRARGPK